MAEVSTAELREFVSSQLAWLAGFLMTKHGMTASEAKELISEVLIRDV